MAKVVMLTPCLMLDTNRRKNKEAMAHARASYPIDAFAVNAQGFQPDDYEEGVTYIGNYPSGVGFVKARNELLEWFYASDYDWAIWMDANARVSTSAMNDFLTVLDAVKRDVLDIDVIFSTLGLTLSQGRIVAKQDKQYFEEVKLISFKGGYEWMHGLFMRNFRKVYGIEPMIRWDCDPRKGTSEDVFFALLLRKLFDCRLAPTLQITKPPSKYSTWMTNAGSYDYPKIDWRTVKAMVEVYCRKNNFERVRGTKSTIRLQRVADMQNRLKPYRSRAKEKKTKGLLR